MRNRIIALSYCIILLSQYLYGDNVIIADKELKTPISAAVVSVWIENSDVALKLISDDSGIVKIPKNATRLTIRKLGYEEQKLNARIYSEGDTIFLEMGYILREVTVSAIRNKFHVKSDRYVYDVASDSALVGKSAFEALGRIPILNTTIDGHISSMQGKNLVYKVNGLSSLTFTGDLQTALRSLKADYIKRIELKSDPMGNNPNTLEINIVTKGRLEGYQANATTRLNDYLFANVMYRFRSDVDDDSLGTNIENIKLKQHLLDGSLAYKFAVERFSLYCGVGVRSYNDRVTNSKYGPEYSYSRRNLIWQPTLTMSFVPNSKQRYELSYSMTSLIPDISVMNPFVFQDEPTRVSYGNPGISPEKNQKLSLSANYNLNKLYFSTSISGGYASDVILKYSFLDGKNILNTTYDNIANRWNLGISSFLTWNITRKTSLRTNLSLDYIDYSSHRLNSSNSGVQFSGNVNLSQELPFGIYGELRGNYNTPWINFQGKGGTNYGYGVSLARNFLSNKLRVSLSAENFAPTYYSRTYTTLGEGYYQTRKSRRFHAYYSLTVSYSFGNLRARVKETETSISNTDIKSSYDE